MVPARLSYRTHYVCSYAARNSSRVMPDCVRIVLSVEPLICR